jgi:Replication initiator protein A
LLGSLFNTVLGREVLTLSRDYFRISGGLERRLYEMARKHYCHQTKWRISLNCFNE